MKAVDYVIEPNALMRELKKTTFINKNSNDDFVGIYHTHPHGVPFPSHIDLNRAEYNVAYLIFGGSQREFRAWALDKKEEQKTFREIPMIDLEWLEKHSEVV